MVTGEHLFTFAIIADSHVTEAEATAIGGYDIDTVKLAAARSRLVVHQLNRLAPDFVVHLGDITHPEPGSPAYEDSAGGFHRIYEDLKCPLYWVAGNHDIGEKAFPGEPEHFDARRCQAGLRGRRGPWGRPPQPLHPYPWAVASGRGLPACPVYRVATSSWPEAEQPWHWALSPPVLVRQR